MKRLGVPTSQRRPTMDQGMMEAQVGKETWPSKEEMRRNATSQRIRNE